MDNDKIYADLTEIFNEVFMSRRYEVLTPSNCRREDVPGWDSFKQIEIMVCVEERYGFKLNTKEIDALKNVGDLAGIIARKS